MAPRILQIVKNEPHGETVTEIELPDDAPAITVRAVARSVDGSPTGSHDQTVDLIGVTKISIK